MASSSSNPAVFRYIPHDRDCCICQEPLAGKVVVLKCGHVFKEACLNSWTESQGSVPQLSLDEPISNTEKCPQCRVKLEIHKTYQNYINYKENMKTEGKTEVEKRKIEKRKNKNEHRFKRKQRQLERRTPDGGDGDSNGASTSASTTS